LIHFYKRHTKNLILHVTQTLKNGSSKEEVNKTD